MGPHLTRLGTTQALAGMVMVEQISFRHQAETWEWGITRTTQLDSARRWPQVPVPRRLDSTFKIVRLCVSTHTQRTKTDNLDLIWKIPFAMWTRLETIKIVDCSVSLMDMVANLSQNIALRHFLWKSKRNFKKHPRTCIKF